MIDTRAALATVIQHATDPAETEYATIAPTVEALAGSGATELAPRLQDVLDRFLADRNEYGRDLIAVVLARIAGTAALPALLAAAAHDLGDDQDTLRTEIDALLSADPSGSRRLLRAQARSGPPEQRRIAVQSLAGLSRLQDADVLVEAGTDTDARVRQVAVSVVPAPRSDDRSFQLLIGTLQDPDREVRAAAISRLGASGRADAVPPLTATFAPSDRVAVAYALGRLRSRTAVPALLRLLADGEQRVRDQARDALGEIGGTEAVDALLAESRDGDGRSRAQAAKALAKAADSDPRVVPRLHELGSDEDPQVRAALLSGLATSDAGSTRWAALVAGLADDPDWTVRQRVEAVGHHLVPGRAAPGAQVLWRQ